MNTADTPHSPAYLLFTCFGDEGHFYECAFALLTLSQTHMGKPLPIGEIWIYTDQPGWFGRFAGCPLPLHFREITKNDIQQWRGAIDYLYRVKMEVLADFTKQRSGNIICVDTDVIFTQPLDAMIGNIEAGIVYMHTMEGRPNSRATPMLRRMESYFGKLDFKNDGYQETMMWNSGVIGFNSLQYNIAPDAIRITDQIYPRDHSIRVVEQFAFSAVFQFMSAKLLAATPWVIHYWFIKEIRSVLRSFFTHYQSASWGELATMAAQVQPYELLMAKKAFLKRQSPWSLLRNHQWEPEIIWL